jgi:hypothetical protein
MSGYYFYNAGTWTVGGGPLDASSIKIGTNAGLSNQGLNAIAIGYNAGQTNQHANSIIINSTGTDLSSFQTNSLYIAPIRNTSSSNILYYNSNTKEMSYDTYRGSANWNTTCNNMYNKNSGFVGIGITNPTQMLDVSGNIRIRQAIYDSTNSTGNTGQVLVTTVNGTQWRDVSSAGGASLWTVSGNDIYNGNTGIVKIRNTLDMSGNNIRDVSSLLFRNTTYLTSAVFSGNSSSDIRSLIYNNDGSTNVSNPVSIMRYAHFVNDMSFNIPTAGTRYILPFGNQDVNQLNLTFADISKSKFIIPNDLSGQYIEIFCITKFNIGANNTEVTMDISAVNNTYKEILDTKYFNKSAAGVVQYTTTYGPHVIRANEFHSGKTYAIYIIPEISNANTKFLRSEIIMKSHYV